MAPTSESDPFVKSRLRLSWKGVTLELLAPHSVFASTWIDKGTQLLLDHLPASEPRSFLDLGCGYGALGLPIAAKFPGARGLLVDRDLFAVEYCRRNAEAHGLANVDVTGSLGYRDVPPAWDRSDWILANFPARAGDRVMEHFISSGQHRLAPGGEMRVVVIAPLAPVVERVAASAKLGGRRVVETAQHAVFAFEPSGDAAPPSPSDDVYLRDAIALTLPGLSSSLRLERPTDLADEPHRLKDAIPLLAESLPEKVSGEGRILVFRCGYGLVPALALTRYPAAAVVATDRDLLATAFTRRNCAWAGKRFACIETARFGELKSRAPFDLILGETLQPLGPEGTLAELEETRRLLAPGGRVLVMGLSKQWRELLKDSSARHGLVLLRSRGAAAIFGN